MKPTMMMPIMGKKAPKAKQHAQKMWFIPTFHHFHILMIYFPSVKTNKKNCKKRRVMIRRRQTEEERACKRVVEQMMGAWMHVDDANDLQKQQLFLAELAKRELKRKADKQWMSACMKVLKVMLNPIQSTWIDPADDERWNQLVDTFILRHYYIKDEEFSGDSKQAFANFLKRHPDQRLVQQTLSWATQNHINIPAPAQRTFSPPTIGDTNFAYHSVIDKFVRTTTLHLKVPINPKNASYKQVHDGIYRSMQLMD